MTKALLTTFANIYKKICTELNDPPSKNSVLPGVIIELTIGELKFKCGALVQLKSSGKGSDSKQARLTNI